MTRRRLPLTLAVVGALIILAALIAASVVRSSDTAALTLGEGRPDVPVVVTEPGVLDAVDPDVTVRATAEDDEPVLLAIGRTSEVEAWLGDADHARVTGLSSWEELTFEVVTGAPDVPADATTSPEDAPPAEEDAPEPGLPDPAGSDLWVVETSGAGAAELDWADRPGRWSLVAATDGTGPAPELEMEWGRQVSTPWLVPGIVVGGLLLVAGVTMLVLGALARREQRRRDDARARQQAGGSEDAAPPVSVTDTDPGTGERLTRRQIREMERAMARADRSRRAGEPGTPPIPLAGSEHADGAVADSDAESPENDDAGPQRQSTGEEPGSTDGAPEAQDGGLAATGGRRPAGKGEPAGAEDSPANDDGSASAGDRPGETAVTDGSAGPGDSPDAATESHDEPAVGGADPDSDDVAPVTPSWRTVWGFGGAAARPPQPDRTEGTDAAAERDQDDDGEERR